MKILHKIYFILLILTAFVLFNTVSNKSNSNRNKSNLSTKTTSTFQSHNKSKSHKSMLHSRLSTVRKSHKKAHKTSHKKSKKSNKHKNHRSGDPNIPQVNDGGICNQANLTEAVTKLFKSNHTAVHCCPNDQDFKLKIEEAKNAKKINGELKSKKDTLNLPKDYETNQNIHLIISILSDSKYTKDNISNCK